MIDRFVNLNAYHQNHDEGWKQSARSKEENEQYMVFTTHPSLCTVDFQVAEYSSDSVIHLWISNYPVAQTEVASWPKGRCSQPLTKRSNPQENGKLWGSVNSLRKNDRSLSSCTLRTGLNILGVQHTRSPETPMSIQRNARMPSLVCLEPRVDPFTLD